MSFIVGVLGLLDATISAMLGVPIFAVLLTGFLMFSVLGLVLMLKDAAYGRGPR